MVLYVLLRVSAANCSHLLGAINIRHVHRAVSLSKRKGNVHIHTYTIYKLYTLYTLRTIHASMECTPKVRFRYSFNQNVERVPAARDVWIRYFVSL